MAAEITLFKAMGEEGGRIGPVAGRPVQSYAATFTPAITGIIRVYANGTPVVLTIGGKSLTVPSGWVEYFAVTGGQEVTVA
ncbi:hypothetical protein ABAC460_23115 [Asticcacaulis sp. AC460]|uniref:hypothetical protein n=1 Tax=Asticcacaulis sp. AC460 TaxID=1282360 RepID=UPI0003C3EFAD|nr:hypothetical protein [Asticcacaulis sp. AC460]ESQ86605.1 hypothetical protein ABAC460_23115 [Asticcacaulis sp. AC460]